MKKNDRVQVKAGTTWDPPPNAQITFPKEGLMRWDQLKALLKAAWMEGAISGYHGSDFEEWYNRYIQIKS